MREGVGGGGPSLLKWLDINLKIISLIDAMEQLNKYLKRIDIICYSWLLESVKMQPKT